LKPGVVLALDLGLCSVKACFRHVALTVLLPILWSTCVPVGSRKSIWPVITWGVGMVVYVGRGADL